MGKRPTGTSRRGKGESDLVVVQAVKTFRIHAELHPPLTSGAAHTLDIKEGAAGIICGPAPDSGHHIVAFDYGRHHTATAIVPADHFVRV